MSQRGGYPQEMPCDDALPAEKGLQLLGNRALPSECLSVMFVEALFTVATKET
jgi:hypothetical protein